MFRRFSVNYALLSILLDATFTALALRIAVFVRPHLPPLPFVVEVPNVNVLNISLAHYLLIPAVWVFIFLLTSVYDPKRNYRIVDEFQTVTLSIGFASLVYAGFLYLVFRDFSRWLLISFVLLDVFFLLGWRTIARIVWRWQGNGSEQRRAIIVGAGQVGQQVSAMLQSHANAGLEFVGYLDDNPLDEGIVLPVIGRVSDVRQIVEAHDIDDVIVAMPQQAYREMGQLVWALQDVPVHVRVVPDYFSLALYRATAEEYAGVPMINLRDPALNNVQRLVKRFVDVLLSGLLILLSSPIMITVALAIRFDSDGPILFTQQRVGENGRIFGMYKFRSMVPNADKLLHTVSTVDEEGNRVFKFKNDPRITRVGRFIRRASLDEMPQLFNVLKGDMSLVGPRPELPWLVQDYEPWQLKRFAVPQGITGWWQVNGRSDKPMHLNTEDDIYYVQNYSLWMDIYILIKTPWVVLRGKGAY
ncbi:MAG: sugar transferase [Anaerolineales bacterium]|nr:sugar transferase [Anaerolineales bacterium]